MESNNEIDEFYLEIVQADEFIKNFDTLEDFKEWAKEGDIEDLKQCISVFEGFELYEHCKIMKDLISDKETITETKPNVLINMSFDIFKEDISEISEDEFNNFLDDFTKFIEDKGYLFTGISKLKNEDE